MTGANNKMGKAFMFTTYPFKTPMHGGQLRCSQLLKCYKTVFSEVMPIAIFNSSAYQKGEWGGKDIPSSPETTNLIEEQPIFESWILGESPTRDQSTRLAVLKLLKKHRPGVLIFEQPYLFSAIMKLCQEINLDPAIINSTQNNETQMMETILKQHSISDETTKKNIQYLNKLNIDEQEIAQQARCSIAVSQQDAESLRFQGAKNVFTAPNGITEKNPQNRHRALVKQIKRELKINQYALFVGSNHFPNVSGFLSVLGSRLGYVPEGTKIILAGGVGQALRRHLLEINEPYESIFWHRVFDIGIVKNEVLAALLEEASCVLLPITSGGGSNLKTAEAIISRRPVLATEHAFRGFEEFSRLHGIEVTPDITKFRERLTNILSNPFMPSDYTQDAEREKVLWNHTLRELPEVLRHSL